MTIRSAIRRKFPLCLIAFLITFAGYDVSAQESCDCPAIWDCSPCTDGITSLSLKYAATGTSAVSIKVEDQHASVFDASISPGDTIVLNGSLSNGRFAGNKLFIEENGVLKTTLNISCSTPLYVKSVFGDFILIGGTTRTGGSLCCDPATLERVPPVFAECPDDITQRSGAATEMPVYWRVPVASDECGEPRVVSTHEPGDLFPIGSTEVVYTATDRSGNTATCSFQVNVNPELDLELTTVLTPDGDGINDEWLLSDIDKYPDNQVTVVDRWGSVIFTASGYDNEKVVWTGRNTSGTVVPTGTYFYAITVRLGTSTVEKRGFLELIRPR